MKNLQQLAEFISHLTYDDLPREVIDRAKWILRDTIGVILGGMNEPDVRTLASHAAQKAPGPVSLFGYHGRVTPEWAVFVHGTAGTTLEMDEGHAFARGHAAIHAVPPALALGQARDASGRDILIALVAGYEVAARAGIATRLRKSVHPFGAWGVLGAAAIAARYQDLNAEDFAGALEVAASYAITPSFETAYQGANVRNTYAGMVNRLGLLAVELYTVGFRGERGGLQTTFGSILGESFNVAALTDGLGERYEMMRGYFKPYSACRYVHGAVDAVLGLRADHAFDLSTIERVDVETYDIAAHLSDATPSTPLAGRFSTPYVVAATLIHGSAGPEIFSNEMLHNANVLDLAARITVSEDKAFTAMTPAKRPARVRLYLANQRVIESMVLGSKGDPDRPMTEQELENKFHTLSDPILGAERGAQVWNRLYEIETLAGLNELLELFTPHSE